MPDDPDSRPSGSGRRVVPIGPRVPSARRETTATQGGLRMKKFAIGLVAAMVMCSAALAFADDMKSMPMPTAGPESKALSKLFTGAWHWTGDCPAGSMGPNSPATKSHGTAKCASMYGGMWYGCDVVDQMGSGKSAMAWKGHMMVGYDMAAKAY